MSQIHGISTPLSGASEKSLHRAIKRVGRTPQDHARWLIAFAYRYEEIQGPASLSLEDVEAILAELQVFLPDDPARDACDDEPEALDAYASRWFRRIRGGIRKLAKGRAWSHALVTHHNFWVPRAVPTKGGRREYTGYIRPHTPHVLHASKTAKDMMAHKICETLTAVGHRLRRCARQGCGRIFVANRRQLYCKKTCGWAARTRKRRAKRRNPVRGDAQSCS